MGWENIGVTGMGNIGVIMGEYWVTRVGKFWGGVIMVGNIEVTSVGSIGVIRGEYWGDQGGEILG